MSVLEYKCSKSSLLVHKNESECSQKRTTYDLKYDFSLDRMVVTKTEHFQQRQEEEEEEEEEPQRLSVPDLIQRQSSAMERFSRPTRVTFREHIDVHEQQEQEEEEGRWSRSESGRAEVMMSVSPKALTTILALSFASTLFTLLVLKCLFFGSPPPPQ